MLQYNGKKWFNSILTCTFLIIAKIGTQVLNKKKATSFEIAFQVF
jgi:hypothetical protein